MEVVRGIQNLGIRDSRRAVVTIGNFDGVHLGHQEIFRLTIEKARASGGIAVAYTFRPHPQVALHPGANVQLLSTYDEKLDLLEAAGLDLVIEEPFSREFSTIAPQQFFNDIIIRLLNAEAVVVGYDFAFGRERQGHLEALERFCKDAGVELTVVPPLRVGNEVVSSSRIRQHLLAGEVDLARRLLGRSFSYRGIVSRGEGRGRKLGFPTANLSLDNKLVLPYGVYATWAVCESLFPGRPIPSVTNIGVRPTFDDETKHPQAMAALVETHLLGESVDLYGSLLEVRFEKRLREERRFSGIDALVAQIARDADDARVALGATK
ncbi:MAG: bifunctional riboflavin kinase/FAD synthetase [Oligoflexia bacterium]|nr:bifunctional riboflavin kinase/FAD synthetase [Oligoflexia bacterium]